MAGTPSPQTISTQQLELTERAERIKGEALLTLSHHIDLNWLREAYRRTRKDGAVGVDGQTAAGYEAHLDENLSSLLDRFKSGRYRAPPVKRVYIPKADGKRLRPIGIPTLEDKILQRAVVMLLEPIYEVEFSNVSYGFRPGRSAHQALQALWKGTMALHEGFLIELDIESFFDRVDHATLRAMVARRVGDGVIRRVIGKWLNAGVMEGNQRSYPEQGTPQGGVISPLLANIYLTEVDAMLERAKEATRDGGWARVEYARYADDLVILVDGYRRHAWLLKAVDRRLREELAKLDLRRNEAKSRIVDLGQGEAFGFLGFDVRRVRSLRGRWRPSTRPSSCSGRRCSGSSRSGSDASTLSPWGG